MFGENLVLGSVGVEEEEVVEVADAVGQRADGEVFGRVGHQVPHHPLTWRQQHQHQQLVSVNEEDNYQLLHKRMLVIVYSFPFLNNMKHLERARKSFTLKHNLETI